MGCNQDIDLHHFSVLKRLTLLNSLHKGIFSTTMVPLKLLLILKPGHLVYPITQCSTNGIDIFLGGNPCHHPASSNSLLPALHQLSEQEQTAQKLTHAINCGKQTLLICTSSTFTGLFFSLFGKAFSNRQIKCLSFRQQYFWSS